MSGMEDNGSLLAICIPTYNRAEILDEALTDLIPKIKRFNFNIVISDNASTDNTIEIVEKHKRDYSGIIYYRQECLCEADQNFEKVLKLGADHSEYMWLLGDAYRIINEEIDRIIKILQKIEYHAIIVNAFDRITQVESKEYNSCAELLKEIGWHMTLMSSLIFYKDLINNAKFKRFYNTNFIQTGIIFEYLNQFVAKAYWYNKNCVYGTKLSKVGTTWFSATFKVFAKNWMEFVLSLPFEIPLKVKLFCIKEHNRQARLFTVGNLLALRKNEWFNLGTYKTYRKYMPYVTNTPRIVIMLILIIPSKALKSIWPIRKYIMK